MDIGFIGLGNMGYGPRQLIEADTVSRSTRRTALDRIVSSAAERRLARRSATAPRS
jgi:3-hydroxyisobutyrate dehydrogenase-like beta-hydroxyacid dehydrogenase